MVKAITSALVDVFTSLAGLLIGAGVVLLILVSLAGAFGIGGMGLLSRRRRRNSAEP